MTPNKTNAEIQADYRARMRARGYRPVMCWIKPEHKERLKRYVRRINREKQDNG